MSYVIVQLSKYLLIVLMLLYVITTIWYLVQKKEEKRRRIALGQISLIVMLDLLAYLVLFQQTGDVTLWVLFGGLGAGIVLLLKVQKRYNNGLFS